MIAPTRPVEATLAVRGSRFLAHLAPAADAASARNRLAERAERRRDATHHCWAYRVWHLNRIEGAGFDAGEPAGTAGRPILGALERPDAVQAVCIVSRWYGGIPLGTGGLTRAYAEAAGAAISAAHSAGALHEVAPGAWFRVRFDYSLTAAVERVAARFAARRRATEHGVRAGLVLSVPADRAEALAAALTEATAGGAEIVRQDDRLEAAS